METLKHTDVYFVDLDGLLPINRHLGKEMLAGLPSNVEPPTPPSICVACGRIIPISVRRGQIRLILPNLIELSLAKSDSFPSQKLSPETSWLQSTVSI
jgi:hypothetical protein